MAVEPDDYDNEDIAGQGEKIQGEEQCEEQELQFPKDGRAQEYKAPAEVCIGLLHSEWHPW